MPKVNVALYPDQGSFGYKLGKGMSAFGDMLETGGKAISEYKKKRDYGKFAEKLASEYEDMGMASERRNAVNSVRSSAFETESSAPAQPPLVDNSEARASAFYDALEMESSIPEFDQKTPPKSYGEEVARKTKAELSGQKIKLALEPIMQSIPPGERQEQFQRLLKNYNMATMLAAKHGDMSILRSFMSDQMKFFEKRYSADTSLMEKLITQQYSLERSRENTKRMMAAIGARGTQARETKATPKPPTEKSPLDIYDKMIKERDSIAKQLKGAYGDVEADLQKRLNAHDLKMRAYKEKHAEFFSEDTKTPEEIKAKEDELMARVAKMMSENKRLTPRRAMEIIKEEDGIK